MTPAAIARLRARTADRIRAFFAARRVLEVQTPTVTACGVTDLHIESVRLADGRFLRTSPEYAHKRLLADGVGDLFELGPVHRAGEHGSRHREEFTLLEWYRIGHDWRTAAEETVELIREATPERAWRCRFVSWVEAVSETTGREPERLDEAAIDAAAPGAPDGLDRPERLDWLFATRIQPSFAPDCLTVVHHYPACQAALARMAPDRPGYAERFEVFAGPLELANGYRELTDADEQRRRFDADNDRRRALGRSPMPIDEDMLAALDRGLPACAGVALGFDRLVMLAAGADDIADVELLPGHA